MALRPRLPATRPSPLKILTNTKPPPLDSKDMGYKFVLYEDKRGEWRWNLKAGNGETVADSSEGYKSKAGAENGIRLVQENAAKASITETPATVQH